ncbi:hypothetical protein AGMMS49921_01120 [Endomicrobiia bacterium]|nr:hypothetical protein AGMMS49921_01120 [Endomicrobiia bacterium]
MGNFLDGEYRTKADMSWVIDEKYTQKLKVVTKVLEAYANIIFKNNSDCKYPLGVFLNPFYNELSMGIQVSSDHETVKEDISVAFKQIKNIAEGNIDLSILAKAKNSIQQLYKDADNDSHDVAIAKSYACSAALHNAPLGEFERFPSTCQSVSREDLKDLASQLLKENIIR